MNGWDEVKNIRLSRQNMEMNEREEVKNIRLSRWRVEMDGWTEVMTLEKKEFSKKMVAVRYAKGEYGLLVFVNRPMSTTHRCPEYGWMSIGDNQIRMPKAPERKSRAGAPF